MYAIFVDGGRQYKVTEGEELVVDFRDSNLGSQLTFDHVLAVGGDSLKLGQPILAGAVVTAEVLGPVQGPKLVVQKMRRRKNFRRKTGHRQICTRVRINKIEASQAVRPRQSARNGINSVLQASASRIEH
jgi:large subunit ribosomal protein L21